MIQIVIKLQENLNYDDFIKKLPINKYKFIDASYIMVEPLSKKKF